MHYIKDNESNFKCYFLMIFSSNGILEKEGTKATRYVASKLIGLEVCHLLFVLSFHCQHTPTDKSEKETRVLQNCKII